MTDDLDVSKLWTSPETPSAARATPAKVRKRREHFVRVPWTWVEKLVSASGKTWQMAVWLLYFHWKGGGAPIKLANGMLRYDGVSRRTKWRALAELEALGLVAVERRPKRSPVVRVLY